MNNLAYTGRDGQTIGRQVEELLRKELGEVGPITFEVEETGAEISVGSILKDNLSLTATPLLTIHFHIAQPRAADLDVHMNRHGLGCYAGPLVFSTVLGKKAGGEVRFGDNDQFTGDAAVSEKLNAQKELCKKCDAFAVTRGGLTGFKIKVPRIFKIVPHVRGAEIAALTLPKSKSLGFGASLRSKEFFEIASQIEALL